MANLRHPVRAREQDMPELRRNAPKQFWMHEENAMLVDLYIGRAMIAPRQLDLDRHATFACSLNRFFSRLRLVLSRQA